MLVDESIITQNQTKNGTNVYGLFLLGPSVVLNEFKYQSVHFFHAVGNLLREIRISLTLRWQSRQDQSEIRGPTDS